MTKLSVLVLGCLLAASLGGCDRPAPTPAETTDLDTGEMEGNEGAPIDPSKVPEQLRPLVPLAEEWGIGDDAQRAARVDDASDDERAKLREALAPHQVEITAWLDSFGEGELSNEAAAFMYLQLAGEETTDH